MSIKSTAYLSSLNSFPALGKKYYYVICRRAPWRVQIALTIARKLVVCEFSLVLTHRRRAPSDVNESSADKRKPFTIRDLLRPYTKALVLGVLAAIGDGVANLLEPWPLKVVLDNVLKSQPAHGWLNHLILSAAGEDKLAILKLAAAAVLVIAIFGAICSYAQKSLTTTVGQWVLHDLRQTLYFKMQRLSLAYHDQARTGDLISRVTGDIDAIQNFITSGLLGALFNILTLGGMVGCHVLH
jgi:ABC-type multidrug transport system fused ATPase/permease subunit